MSELPESGRGRFQPNRCVLGGDRRQTVSPHHLAPTEVRSDLHMGENGRQAARKLCAFYRVKTIVLMLQASCWELGCATGSRPQPEKACAIMIQLLNLNTNTSPITAICTACTQARSDGGGRPHMHSQGVGDMKECVCVCVFQTKK